MKVPPRTRIRRGVCVVAATALLASGACMVRDSHPRPTGPSPAASPTTDVASRSTSGRFVISEGFDVLQADPPASVPDRYKRAMMTDGMPYKVRHRATGMPLIYVSVDEGRRAYHGSVEFLRPSDHVVEVAPESPFYLGAFEVTEDDFESFGGARRSESRITPYAPGIPMTDVSFDAAREWSRRQGLRLPTSEEWAWAATTCSNATFIWGDDCMAGEGTGNIGGQEYDGPGQMFRREFLGDCKLYLNWLILAPWTDRFRRGSPVDAFPSDPIGFYDLCGNSAEWVESAGYLSDPKIVVLRDKYGNRREPPPGSKFEVVAGASFASGLGSARPFARGVVPSGVGTYSIGFRVAADGDVVARKCGARVGRRRRSLRTASKLREEPRRREFGRSGDETEA